MPAPLTPVSIIASAPMVVAKLINTCVGLELAGVEREGLNPQYICVHALIFKRKSALNFNPWAKFHTFRHSDASPSVLLGQL